MVNVSDERQLTGKMLTSQRNSVQLRDALLNTGKLVSLAKDDKKRMMSAAGIFGPELLPILPKLPSRLTSSGSSIPFGVFVSPEMEEAGNPCLTAVKQKM